MISKLDAQLREICGDFLLLEFRDYQARRAIIRFRAARGQAAVRSYIKRLRVAVGRALAAVLENYQQSDGSVVVPEVLRPYMGVDVI
jgi:seryl-tRNA synthetase